jgi:penicillin-binding protein 1A
VKRIAKILGAVAAVFVICASMGAAWLWFYTSDVPPVSQLDFFTPADESQAVLRFCDGTQTSVVALPVQQLGPYSLPALKAAEGEPSSRSPYVSLIAGISGLQRLPHGRDYSGQLASQLTCAKRNALERLMAELRIAHAIQRKFNSQQILTVYVNRAYFGRDVYGIEAGANRYFGKHASNLSLAETAWLVGLIQRPTYFLARPERAIQRRNSVLDEMVKKGSISASEGVAAKSTLVAFQH